MQSFAKEMILRVPAARRVYEQRNSALSECESLRAALDEKSHLNTLQEERLRKLSEENRKLVSAFQNLEREHYCLKSRHFSPAASTQLSDECQRHLDTWLDFDQVPTLLPYQPTFRFSGPYLNKNHELFSTCPLGILGNPIGINIGIDGYLGRGDALKLYEMAYFSTGNILELGTHLGLSTSILAQAVIDANSPNLIEAVDIDPVTNAKARKTLSDKVGFERITFNVCDATKYLDQAILDGRKYGFVFVDHWHGYETTFEAAERLKKVLQVGGFCFFHDFTDDGNADPDHVYGVYHAVIDSLAVDSDFEFYGTYGCCALFRKVK